MKIYKIKKYDDLKIEEIEYIKKTEKSLWYKTLDWNGKEIEERILLNTSYHSFFDTQKEALESLINRAERKLEYAEANVSKYTEIIQKLQN